MGLLDRVANAFRMDDMDDEYEDDFYDDDEIEVKSSAKADTSESKTRVTAMKPTRRSSGGGMEVVVIKPTTVDDAREIVDTLLVNKIVNLNLEGLDVAIAQRIIDFTSGATYAMGGKLQKISNYIFLVTPRSVDVSGDFPELGDVPGFGGASVSKMI